MNPDNIIFLSEIKILESIAVKVSSSRLLKNFLCFFDIFFTLIDNVNLFIKLKIYMFKISNKQLFRDSTNTCTTIYYWIEVNFWEICFKFVKKFLWSSDINLTQITESTQYSIISGLSFLKIFEKFTFQYWLALLYQFLIDPTGSITLKEGFLLFI